MTLAEFLRARIVEDESKLDTATEAEAEYLRHVGMPDTTAAEVRNYWLNEVPTKWSRWLAECEAKRRIVELHDGSHECSTYDHDGDIDNYTLVLGGDCSTMRLLALPYTTHSDYQNEWRP